MWYEKTLDDHSHVDTISLSWIIFILDLNYFCPKGPFFTVSILLILRRKLSMLEILGAK